MPSLLRAISEEGHEIASHYNFHDLMFDQEIDLVEENLVAAISAVEDAIGYKPKGFRAPAFSIPQSRPDIFSLICNYFDYDSSFVLSNKLITSGEYKNMEIFTKNDFKEFPIVPKPFFFENIQIKSGGTFMRLFSSNIMQSVMDLILTKDLYPLSICIPTTIFMRKNFGLITINLENCLFLNV